jgi:hypothetical protein
LQRLHFDPPSDDAARGAPRHLRHKTANTSPIEEDSPRGAASRRSRWLRGWRA